MKLVVFLLALGLWVTAGMTIAAGPSGDYSITPDVIASGGGTSSSTNYTFMTTVGQPAAGWGDGPAYNLCSGYWCRISPFTARAYLPMVRRT